MATEETPVGSFWLMFDFVAESKTRPEIARVLNAVGSRTSGCFDQHRVPGRSVCVMLANLCCTVSCRVATELAIVDARAAPGVGTVGAGSTPGDGTPYRPCDFPAVYTPWVYRDLATYRKGDEPLILSRTDVLSRWFYEGPLDPGEGAVHRLGESPCMGASDGVCAGIVSKRQCGRNV